MSRLHLAFMAVAALGPVAAQAEPTTYASPDEAVGAVVEALEARDREALVAVFGPESEDVVFTGDAGRDRANWSGFLEDWREANRIVTSENGQTATLFVGRDQWPFPAPLEKEADGRWSFDAEAARTEVLERRIGRNELDVIDLLRAYVRVQSDYRKTDWDGDGVMEFASSILSDSGTRDGLYWPAEAGAPESPIGDFVARASADGYSLDGRDVEPEPYLGYYYRVLQSQGDAVPGGAMSYLVNGHMVAGHALLAFPSAYAETGVMSFLVGENGIVYEADLGEGTLDRADAIDQFDLDEGWIQVDQP
ncbi:DUF2950 domain-containing protein [Geminicoccus roseus]|uniref:DUF2950 domain-containing protein n=1 Tax=Geminicoccus roseus TaxID=404900 RepID=UPI000405D133|nr:DUF2950 domain-containing protein [Geminicoccus roseus]